MKKFVALLLTLAAVGALGVSAMAAEPGELQASQTLWFTAPEEYEVTLAGTDASEGVVSAIAEGLKNRTERIDISSYNVSVNDARYYYEVALTQATDVYWINNVPSVYHYNGQSQALAIGPRYMTSEQETTYKSKIDEITKGVGKDWSDFEKALYLNDYLTTHAKYDCAAASSGNVDHAGYTTYELLVNGKGVCQAYTMAYRSLLNAVGIVNCTARSESMNHIWNLVEIGGQWYHVDTTWNDPKRTAMETDPSAPDLLGSAEHGYFLLSDEAIKVVDKTQARYDTHQGWVAAPSDTTCTSTTYDEWYGNTVTSPFVPLGDSWYYILYYATLDENGYLSEDGGFFCATEDPKENQGDRVYTITARWKVWGNSSSQWPNVYSGLCAWNGLLVYNTPTELRSYDPKTKQTNLLYKPDTTNGYLYGFSLSGDTATCLLAQHPSDLTAWELETVAISPYASAGEGKYSTYKKDGTLYVRQDAANGILVLALYDANGCMEGLAVTSKQNEELYADIPESGYLKIFALNANYAPRCAAQTVPAAA